MKAITWLAAVTCGAALTATAFASTPEGWTTDLDKAFEKAKTEKKSVLVELDFPKGDPAVKEKNQPFAEKYKIEGFPTVILFTPEGKEFTRFYASAFPKTEDFLAHLDKALEKKDLD
jgi:hypothetical protein